MERLIKKFRTVTSISIGIGIVMLILGAIGLVNAGFYPGFIVLLLVTLTPIISILYAEEATNKSNAFQKKYYKTFIIINLLAILIVLYLSFVIVHDNVLLAA